MNLAKQLIAAVLGAALLANAAAMLFAGPWWYGAVPGVRQTGPYNAHFIMDIGAAYLVVAAALIRRGLARRAAPGALGAGALIAAAAVLDLHALIHLAHAAMEGVFDGRSGGEIARDVPGVYLPAILATWIGWPPAEPLKEEPPE